MIINTVNDSYNCYNLQSLFVSGNKNPYYVDLKGSTICFHMLP